MSDANFANAEDARFQEQRLQDLAAACDQYEMPTLAAIEKQIFSVRAGCFYLSTQQGLLL